MAGSITTVIKLLVITLQAGLCAMFWSGGRCHWTEILSCLECHTPASAVSSNFMVMN